LNEQQPTLWAIVELFGHQRIAGRVSEQTIGGSAFVRIDVPEVCYQSRARNGDSEDAKTITRIQAPTRSFGPGAIYSINWCDEGAARMAAQSIKHEPIDSYSVEQALRNLPPEERQRLFITSSKPAEQRSLVDADVDDDVPY
jgi:hypothetical protein